MRGEKRCHRISRRRKLIHETALKADTTLAGWITKRVLLSVAKDAQRIHL